MTKNHVQTSSLNRIGLPHSFQYLKPLMNWTTLSKVLYQITPQLIPLTLTNLTHLPNLKKKSDKGVTDTTKRHDCVYNETQIDDLIPDLVTTTSQMRQSNMISDDSLLHLLQMYQLFK